MNEEILKIRAYFGKTKDAAGNLITKSEVNKAIRDDFGNFCSDVVKVRNGYIQKKEDGKTVEVPGKKASFSQMLQVRYGEDIKPKDYLKAMGVFYESMSLQEACFALGGPELSTGDIGKLLKDHTTFSSTKSYDSEYRFLIPELIIDAIDLSYMNAGISRKWIALKQPMGNSDEITLPYITIGVGMPSRIGEGASIPKGRIKMSQKKASSFKIGEGFQFTYELLRRAKIPLMAKSMESVGQMLALGRDTENMRIVLNGEQNNGSESAAVIGVENPSLGFQAKDIKRAVARLKRLGFNIDRMIVGEDDGIDISNLPEFRGYAGDTKQANIRTILGLPPNLEMDTYVLPSNQIVLFDSNKTLIELESNGYLVEQQGESDTQTVNLWITDRIGSAIHRRDARLIIDKSIAFNSLGFPDFMDIDSYISKAFGQ